MQAVPPLTLSAPVWFYGLLTDMHHITVYSSNQKYLLFSVLYFQYLSHLYPDKRKKRLVLCYFSLPAKLMKGHSGPPAITNLCKGARNGQLWDEKVVGLPDPPDSFCQPCWFLDPPTAFAQDIALLPAFTKDISTSSPAFTDKVSRPIFAFAEDTVTLSPATGDDKDNTTMPPISARTSSLRLLVLSRLMSPHTASCGCHWAFWCMTGSSPAFCLVIQVLIVGIHTTMLIDCYHALFA